MGELERLLNERTDLPLNIAIISPYLWTRDRGGVNRHIETLYKELIRRGHAVKIFGRFPRNFSSAVLDLEDMVDTGGWSIPMRNGGSVTKVVLYSRRWGGIIKYLANNFDVVNAQAPEALGLPSRAIRELDRSKVAIITTVHASGKIGLKARGYSIYFDIKKYKGQIAGNVHQIIPVSRPAAELFERLLPVTGLTESIVPNPVDTELFSPEGKRLVFPNEKTTILFVGRHGKNEKRKGFRYLAHAFKQVVSDKSYLDTVHLLIGGVGRVDKKSLRGIPADCYTILGAIAPDELPQYYRSVSMVVAPSQSNESFGYVPAEAMSSGTPVIMSNIDGYVNVATGNASLTCQEANKNGYFTPFENTGLLQCNGAILFEARNAVQLATGIKWVADHPEFRHQLSATRRKTIVDNFSVNAVVDRLEKIYYNALMQLPDESNIGKRLLQD